MVLHELTTNAAKCGAFRDHSGRVLLRWRWLRNASHGPLAIEWQEIGGPRSFAPDAYDCIMARPRRTCRVQGCGAFRCARSRAPLGSLERFLLDVNRNCHGGISSPVEPPARREPLGLPPFLARQESRARRPPLRSGPSGFAFGCGSQPLPASGSPEGRACSSSIFRIAGCSSASAVGARHRDGSHRRGPALTRIQACVEPDLRGLAISLPIAAAQSRSARPSSIGTCSRLARRSRGGRSGGRAHGRGGLRRHGARQEDRGDLCRPPQQARCRCRQGPRVVRYRRRGSAGVNGTDPFIIIPAFLKELKELGFSGVQKFPTVGIIDGTFPRQSRGDGDQLLQRD
jgi:hypothetical protein